MNLRRGRSILVLFAVIAATGLACGQDYAIGADVSFLAQAEKQGVDFKDEGVTRPGLQILKDHGYNWVRLRLFHTPTQLPNDLPYTIALAKDAKKLGFTFLLDYHYADDWADPGKQPIPKAWQGNSHEELVQAVFEYTRDTIAAFRDAGALPDMIQIGNEIINGVDAGRGNNPRPKIMIHIDRGADLKRTKEFFDKLNSYEVPYDIIGQSYYPWWHGSLNDLRQNLEFMAREYQKDIIVVEAAYNWQPGNYINQPPPFQESPDGQRQFLDELNRVVMQTPNNQGKGVFWWEPAVKGRLAIRGFYDDQHNALPVVTVFDRFTRK